MAKGGKFGDTNGRREPGKINVVSGKKTVLAAAKKTSSSGFKEGGAISGAGSTPTLAHRARGGRTSAPFSAAGSSSARSGSSTSGHEGE
jgi:hypothetical protein